MSELAESLRRRAVNTGLSVIISTNERDEILRRLERAEHPDNAWARLQRQRDELVERAARLKAAAEESSPDDIRAQGWAVAIHNDYRTRGLHHTFWLFTHAESGRFVRGEGITDAAALNQVRAVLAAASAGEGK